MIEHSLFSGPRLCAAAVLGTAAATVAALVSITVTAVLLDPFAPTEGFVVDDTSATNSLVVGGTVVWMATFVAVGAFSYGRIDEPTA
ncbi:MAG: hypothetical protein AAGC53_04160 [Actinomycetota bacterium]